MREEKKRGGASTGIAWRRLLNSICWRWSASRMRMGYPLDLPPPYLDHGREPMAHQCGALPRIGHGFSGTPSTCAFGASLANDTVFFRGDWAGARGGAALGGDGESTTTSAIKASPPRVRTLNICFIYFLNTLWVKTAVSQEKYL